MERKFNRAAIVIINEDHPCHLWGSRKIRAAPATKIKNGGRLSIVVILVVAFRAANKTPHFFGY